nr:protein Jumonji isoform X1 [Onthophagus taurus]XP_022914072.1 protein Jumonji isoform X2 [Onthophagus taurus]
MVVNRGEMKRKRKEDACINLLDHSPKRTKVHAQRKFAQGSNVSSPVITPIKEIETQERKDVLPEPIELLPMKRPNTEDFLTFLCFRGTPILPPNLNFFNNANTVHSQSPEDKKEAKNGPIMTAPIGKSPNERPFIAFGVRKRADPIVISKQMDKKRRHALALQALRRKYQEQKMAKIRAIAISKISEKVSTKNVVRTRSISKTETNTNTKKNVCHKTKVKVVATKRIARRTLKQPIRPNITPNINSKMCLRSFRGRYIHRELRTSKTKPKDKKIIQNLNAKRKIKKIESEDDESESDVKESEEKQESEETSSSSEFSSDDNEPLVKKAKVKKMVTQTKKQDTENIRLTRSQRLLGNPRKHPFQTVITRLSTIRATTRLANKIIQKTGVIRNTRRIETIKKNTIKKDVIIKRPTRGATDKKLETDTSDIKTRSRTHENETTDKNKVSKTVETKKKIVETKKSEIKKIKNDDAPYHNTKRQIQKRRIVPMAKATVTYKIKKPGLEKSNVDVKTKATVTKKSDDKKTVIVKDKAKEKDCKEKVEIKKEKKLDQSQSSDDQKAGPSRPSRKTKEAAALYMELLGQKLVNDMEMDDDISIDSFPELPNVKKTEQRENELKAKVKIKDVETKSKNDPKSLETDSKKSNLIKKQVKVEIKDEYNLKNKLIDEKVDDKKDKESKKSIQDKKSSSNSSVENEAKKQTLPTVSDDKTSNKDIDKDKKESPPKTTVKETKINQSKNLKETNTKIIKESEIDSLSESDTSSKNIKTKSKKIKNLKKKPKCDQSMSFSDSDEEPLSNLTKPKDLKDKNKEHTPEKKFEPKTENFYKNKPKRECTKRPQNYLALYSSSDEEKYFHGFIKTETIKPEVKVELDKCTHSIPSSDLLCKDVSRRFGKGKVNMSTEQIEKWLNDSALAGMIIKKEEEEIKFDEKVDLPTAIVEKPKIDIAIKTTPESVKTIEGRERLSSTSNQSQEITPPAQLMRIPSNEKKMIFKKLTETVKNINAFSVSNESSVYAFEAEEDSSISTPFRRPSRRPSSTATSKSEDDVTKLEDANKMTGRFRLPALLKTDQKLLKQDITASLSAEESNSVGFVPQIIEPFTDNSNSECQMDTDDNDHSFYTPQQITKSLNNSKGAPKAKPISGQIQKKNMCPPINTLQKTKSEKLYVKQVQAGKSCDRSSETSEDFKYKIPSSPSASSSSSAKLYKRPTPKSRSKIFEFSPPVNATEFPGIQAPAQMVEAPVYHPSEKEFQDPLEYIEKIRPTAEKFGICRIVPPANFKPECKVSDDMRFTAYNQYVNKMLHRWGPNFKELMAIKKYLQTQNISLTHPPWIGGMEIDLPRLYQTVQTLGGLKEVIEKKRWPRVSEAMKIPKSAQDRVTKLDDIYCKYLLPYDTLSPAEREKLFDEVETEWAKRESKALSSIQQTEDTNKASTESSESESETDDEADECIVKGRNMALNAFYRIARNTMSMWFKTMEPPAQEVEQEFWKHVAQKQNHICVHSGSIDSGSWGYGFAVTKNSPFARHAWNLKVLTNNSGSVLKYMGPIMGVTVPTLHVGMVFSGCCWYRDPHSLPWIEYLHTGANKIWYGIPDSMSEKFHQTILKISPNYCRNKSIWLPSDTVMIPPNLLVENGVSLCRTVQEPGHFIVVFPKVFTSSLCTGYVVSESVYFAPSCWLDTAQVVFEELRQNCEPSMFSLERLILSITMDQRSSIEILRQITPDVQKICEREKTLRGKLREMGLVSIEKLPIPESSNARKRKKLQSDAGDYECEICRTNLFISLVSDSQEDVVYCLEHAIESVEEKRMEIKNCKLMFTYSYEELEGLVDKINKAIEAKLQKKLLGKSISMVVSNK